MHFEGVVKKMTSEYSSVVNYFIEFENSFIHLNQFLEKSFTIECIGTQCLSCSSSLDIFKHGFCKKCFFNSPRAGLWNLYPEKSQAHLNIEDRDLDYEKKIQLQPHIVYLSNTGSVKVGVTKKTQIPTRWIDQGAHEAIEILETPNRFLAGCAEVALKKHVNHRTNPNNMLKNQRENINLHSFKDHVKTYIPSNLIQYFSEKNKVYSFEFPVLKYPKNPKQIYLTEKGSNFSGKLYGVKGQYLIFDNNQVLQFRNHEGYIFKISISA